MSRRRARSSSSSTSSSSARFSAKNGGRVPVALDQRVPDEQLAGQLRVDPAVLRPCGRRRSAGRTASPARGHDRAALGVPARLAVLRLTRCRRAARPTPARSARRAGPQPRGLDQLGGHHPARRLLRQRRAGEDREARAARAEVLAPLRRPQPTCDSSPAAARWWISRRARRRRLVERDARLRRRLAQLAVRGPATRGCAGSAGTRACTLAELVARQLALLLAQVAPQVEQARKSECSSAKRACELVGLPAAARPGRSRGSWIDSAGGDDQHLVDAARAVGLEHHPASRGSTGSWRARPSGVSRRPSSSSARPSSCSSATPSRPGGGPAGRRTGSPRRRRGRARPSAGSPRRGWCAGSPGR
jgi:hypothetical protein